MDVKKRKVNKMIKKLLIANRGEIAVRIIETCKAMGIETVAIYSEADADALFVRLADESYLIGPPKVNESYLKTDKILEIAKDTKVDAIHPGYGFEVKTDLLFDSVSKQEFGLLDQKRK